MVIGIFGIFHWMNVTIHDEFRPWNCIIKPKYIGNVR